MPGRVLTRAPVGGSRSGCYPRWHRADTVRAHPDDPVWCALEFDPLTDLHVAPWHEDQVQRDRERANRFEVLKAGGAPGPARDPLAPLLAAARFDPDAARAAFDGIGWVSFHRRTSWHVRGGVPGRQLRAPRHTPWADPSRCTCAALTRGNWSDGPSQLVVRTRKGPAVGADIETAAYRRFAGLYETTPLSRTSAAGRESALISGSWPRATTLQPAPTEYCAFPGSMGANSERVPVRLVAPIAVVQRRSLLKLHLVLPAHNWQPGADDPVRYSFPVAAPERRVVLRHEPSRSTLPQDPGPPPPHRGI